MDFNYDLFGAAITRELEECVVEAVFLRKFFLEGVAFLSLFSSMAIY